MVKEEFEWGKKHDIDKAEKTLTPGRARSK